MRMLVWTSFATLLSLVVYFATLIRTGAARQKYNVPAPAMTGDPIFERHYRVQANTLESLIWYLPSLWIFGVYWGDRIAAALAALWIVGRIIYMFAYVAEPKSRSLGFGLSALAGIVLLIGGIVGAVRAILAVG